METIEPELLEVPESSPPAGEFWAVMSYYLPGKWWKIWPDLWPSEEQAIEHVKGLSGCWRWRRIVHIKVGGE